MTVACYFVVVLQLFECEHLFHCREAAHAAIEGCQARSFHAKPLLCKQLLDAIIEQRCHMGCGQCTLASSRLTKRTGMYPMKGKLHIFSTRPLCEWHCCSPRTMLAAGMTIVISSDWVYPPATANSRSRI